MYHPQNRSLAEIWEMLQTNLRRLAGGRDIALAFSGGLDSRFLAQACMAAGVDTLALHFSAPQMPKSENAFALRWLKKHALPFKALRLDPLELDEVRLNHRERCYFCKKLAFSALLKLAGKRIFCDGSNASDIAEYRPGRKALKELKVCSPLAEYNIDKLLIRRLAVFSGLDDPQQAAKPCLLTRFDYGLQVEIAMLRRLDAAETDIALLLKNLRPPFDGFRLRLLRCADTPGKINPELHLSGTEQPGPLLIKTLQKILRGHAFENVPILSMPKLSGFFDRKNEL